MLVMYLAMLETEQDQRQFTKLYNTYEKKIYAVVKRASCRPLFPIMNVHLWYAKDTSKKIRAVFRSKGISGRRLSANAPYGYIRDKDGHLLVDEETSPAVELIFRLRVEGNGPGKIARMLKERNCEA